MLSLEQIRNARWEEIYLFLSQGNPPLIVIFLGINTLFFMLFLVRRATNRNRMRTSTVYFVQGAVILANAFVLFREDATRYLMMLKGIL
jgi:hypothetical protein